MEKSNIVHPGQIVIENIRGKKPKELDLEDIIDLFLCGDTTICVYVLMLTNGRNRRALKKRDFTLGSEFVQPVIYNLRDRFRELWGDDDIIAAIVSGEIRLERPPDMLDVS